MPVLPSPVLPLLLTRRPRATVACNGLVPSAGDGGIGRTVPRLDPSDVSHLWHNNVETLGLAAAFRFKQARTKSCASGVKLCGIAGILSELATANINGAG